MTKSALDKASFKLVVVRILESIFSLSFSVIFSFLTCLLKKDFMLSKPFSTNSEELSTIHVLTPALAQTMPIWLPMVPIPMTATFFISIFNPPSKNPQVWDQPRVSLAMIKR